MATLKPAMYRLYLKWRLIVLTNLCSSVKQLDYITSFDRLFPATGFIYLTDELKIYAIII